MIALLANTCIWIVRQIVVLGWTCCTSDFLNNKSHKSGMAMSLFMRLAFFVLRVARLQCGRYLETAESKTLSLYLSKRGKERTCPNVIQITFYSVQSNMNLSYWLSFSSFLTLDAFWNRYFYNIYKKRIYFQIYVYSTASTSFINTL